MMQPGMPLRTELFRPLVLALGLVAGVCLAVPAAAQVSFATKSDLAAGASPASVAVGDVNGDGVPDLVAVNTGANTVSVFLGTGSGLFGSKTDFPTGNLPHGVALGDFNGDGKLDIVVANTGADTMSVLLGIGAGTFGTRTNFAAGAAPFYVAVGDVNSDGKPDLVVANVNTDTVSVLLGTGTGSFGPNTDFATGHGPRAVAIADLNLDGKLDVVTANLDANSVSVLLGAGAASLAAKIDFATGAGPFALRIGDLDSDRRPDLVVANVSENTLSVFLNTTPVAPTIAAIANQTTNEDTATVAIAVTVDDVDTAVASLTLSGSSSNTTLVPNANIVFGGSGTSRTVTVAPAANQSGAATITVTVSDGSLSASTTFTVTVTAVNDAPTIAAIANQTTNQDTATAAIAVTVDDIDTAVASLTLSGSSSNTTLVPNANIVFGGSGANRTVTVTPAANQSGAATITVTVSDGRLKAATAFGLTVTANTASDPVLRVDGPANGSTIGQDFTVSGWAIDRGAGSGTGIDAVHVYAYPNPGSGAAGVFLGSATYGGSRSDVGNLLGGRFTSSGFTLAVSALAPGSYQIAAFGHSVVTHAFGAPTSALVTVVAPQSNPAMSLDGPSSNSTVGRTVTAAGWAIDLAATIGTGIDAVHVWAYPGDGSSGQFLGAASYGLARPDIGAAVGSQFANSGFRLSAVVQPPGTYRIVAFAHSRLANAFNAAVAADNVTVQSSNTNAVLFVDTPGPNTTGARPFTISGWAVDSGAASGTGIDAVAVWAFPTSGAPATLVGLGAYGSSRPDIAALLGDARFTNAGFTFTMTGANLPTAGGYDLIVFGRSTVTNAFTVARVVRVTVQ